MNGQNFILVGSDSSDLERVGHRPELKHYRQQTGFTCGAAALSMITGFTEAQCRKLARTTSRGTSSEHVAEALRQTGFSPHSVGFGSDGVALEDVLPQLIRQSHRWPLYLALRFDHEGRDSLNRKRGYVRRHACVLSEGRFLDPGELHELDAEATGHLCQRGIRVIRYILVEGRPSVS